MGAWDDPRYKVLATRSATILGTNSPKIINAIMAQWRCEIGANDYYPPARNNPGNVAEDAAKAIGFPYTVPDRATNPQPGNPIVTFDTPERGADAHGTLLKTLPRYKPVRDAVAADDPIAYFNAIVSSGYGPGSTACMVSVYVDPASEAPTSIGPRPDGADGWIKAEGLGKLFAKDSKGILYPVFFNFYFQAWVGEIVIKTWKPGPNSTLRYEAKFRKILGPVHTGQYVRLTDQGKEIYDI